MFKNYTIVSLFIIFYLFNPLTLGNALAKYNTFQSHKVVYTLELKESRKKNIIDVKGKLAIELINSCPGYTVSQRVRIYVLDNNGNLSSTDASYSTWESFDGKLMNFNSRTYLNNNIKKAISGKAKYLNDELILESKNNRKIIKSKNKRIIFPTEHLKQIISEGTKGNLIISRKIFDGSDFENIYYASSHFSPYFSKKYIDNRRRLLRGLVGWTVNIAYFNIDSFRTIPDYEVSFTLYENGVLDDIILDYGDFVIKGKINYLDYTKINC
ncbi:cell envelope integrity EipB family protein [Alphaproteobacteria bacterium]|nr:cell envelope integrity EipB family protein [Alphaproteobacteria bacterium]